RTRRGAGGTWTDGTVGGHCPRATLCHPPPCANYVAQGVTGVKPRILNNLRLATPHPVPPACAGGGPSSGSPARSGHPTSTHASCPRARVGPLPSPAARGGLAALLPSRYRPLPTWSS